MHQSSSPNDRAHCRRVKIGSARRRYASLLITLHHNIFVYLFLFIAAFHVDPTREETAAGDTGAAQTAACTADDRHNAPVCLTLIEHPGRYRGGQPPTVHAAR